MKILCLVSCFCGIDNICFLFAGKKDSMNNNDKWGEDERMFVLRYIIYSINASFAIPLIFGKDRYFA